MEYVCPLGVDFTRNCSCNLDGDPTSVRLGLHHDEDELDAHNGPPLLELYVME
jgi:hypothetical protein